jgi:hypothetical protein
VCSPGFSSAASPLPKRGDVWRHKDATGQIRYWQIVSADEINTDPAMQTVLCARITLHSKNGPPDVLAGEAPTVFGLGGIFNNYFPHELRYRLSNIQAYAIEPIRKSDFVRSRAYRHAGTAVQWLESILSQELREVFDGYARPLATIPPARQATLPHFSRGELIQQLDPRGRVVGPPFVVVSHDLLHRWSEACFVLVVPEEDPTASDVIQRFDAAKLQVRVLQTFVNSRYPPPNMRSLNRRLSTIETDEIVGMCKLLVGL